jgi:hypothetical protein
MAWHAAAGVQLTRSAALPRANVKLFDGGAASHLDLFISPELVKRTDKRAISASTEAFQDSRAVDETHLGIQLRTNRQAVSEVVADCPGG